MKVLENLKAKELVAIGALQEMNTIENIVNLSEQLRNETGKSVTIFSKRITMFELLAMYGKELPEGVALKENDGNEEDENLFLKLPRQGIILIDNLDDIIFSIYRFTEIFGEKSWSELHTKVLTSLSYHAKKTDTTIVVVMNTPELKDSAGKAMPDLRYVSGYCYFINYCNHAFLWKMTGENSKLELVLCKDDDGMMADDACFWLLRRDGEIFPMERDMAIDGEPSREIQIENIVWLFEHTLREDTKIHITAFIRRLCVTNGKPWEVFYIDERLESKLKNIFMYECDSAGVLGIYDYFDKVLFDFDEEFLHVCLGGEYHPIQGKCDLYFRISSEDFDWSNVIKNFKSKVCITYTSEHITVDKYARGRNPKIDKEGRGEGLWYFYG